MSDQLPRTTHRDMTFRNGSAIGISNRWEKGQYCAILTRAGIVGCGIYDLKTPAEFGQAIAIAKGTPARPLTEPEDLLDARIVGTTPQAAALGIQPGMTGRDAVERMLQAQANLPAPPPARIAVKSIDHATLVVKDLAASRRFYVDLLGMREVPRPAFSFDGLWFQAGATQIHLILEYAGSGPAGNLLPEARRNSRTQHLAFLVDDAGAAVPLLTAAGARVLSGPKPRPDGFQQVFVTDPDGHVIELCSPPAAAPA
jgi:catechol 2,3-dioxygenase-like lactoylglutathione lyase family enzyme/uncharacterized protein YunC (DUF1805 family)